MQSTVQCATNDFTNAVDKLIYLGSPSGIVIFVLAFELCVKLCFHVQQDLKSHWYLPQKGSKRGEHIITGTDIALSVIFVGGTYIDRGVLLSARLQYPNYCAHRGNTVLKHLAENDSLRTRQELVWNRATLGAGGS